MSRGLFNVLFFGPGSPIGFPALYLLAHDSGYGLPLSRWSARPKSSKPSSPPPERPVNRAARRSRVGNLVGSHRYMDTRRSLPCYLHLYITGASRLQNLYRLLHQPVISQGLAYTKHLRHTRQSRHSRRRCLFPGGASTLLSPAKFGVSIAELHPRPSYAA